MKLLKILEVRFWVTSVIAETVAQRVPFHAGVNEYMLIYDM